MRPADRWRVLVNRSGHGRAFAVLALVLLAGCGGSSSSSRSPAKTSSSASPSLTTRSTELRQPVPAKRADAGAVTKLVQSYHAAMLADDGARGCALLTAERRQSMTEGSHKSCAAVLTDMCRRAAQEKLAHKVAVQRVIQSRPSPGEGAAQGPSVTFSVSTSVGVSVQIEDSLTREHGLWRLDDNGSKSWATGGASRASLAKISDLPAVCV